MVEVSRLTNGLIVASDPMRDLETAAIGVWIKAGTRFESVANNGVAHFLEHMAFKGTSTRSAFDIAREVEAVGGAINAYTAREQTAYYLRVLDRDWPLALEILADILRNSTLDAVELERERAVILQEIGQSLDTPDDIIFDHLQATAYSGQAMGLPVLGSAASVDALLQGDLASFMADFYQPQQIVISAAGAVRHADLFARAEALFGDWQNRATPAPLDAPSFTAGEYREESDLEQVHLVLGFAGPGLTEPDYYPALIYSNILGGGMASRLFQEVREKRGLVYSVFSFLNVCHDSGLFGIYAGTGEAASPEVLAVITEELAKMEHILPEELARAKAQLRAGVLMARERCSGRAEQLAGQLLAFGRPVPPEEVVSKLEAVTEEDVTRLARGVAKQKPALASLGPLSALESYDTLAARFG